MIAGRINFAPGFMLKPLRFGYGGALGNGLQAPVFTPAQTIIGTSESSQGDNIKVHIFTREITTEQKKNQQSTQLATL